MKNNSWVTTLIGALLAGLMAVGTYLETGFDVHNPKMWAGLVMAFLVAALGRASKDFNATGTPTDPKP